MQVNCKLVDSQQFFIYVTYKTVELPLERWSGILFQWHAPSFYGTTLTRTNINGKPGVLISAYDWLEILATKSFNDLMNWHWDPLSSASLSLSEAIFENIQVLEYKPSGVVQEEQGTLQLPEKIENQFASDFWSTPLMGISLDEENATEKQTVKSFATNWFRESVKAEPTYQKIIELESKLIEKGISTDGLSQFFDHDRWQQFIGVETEAPFTIGVRLSDPDFEQDQNAEDWKLEVFLRSKKSPEIVILWSDRRKAAPSWKKHFYDVELEIARWKFMFPWFTAEINDTQAWSFLMDASEILVKLGVEVLLPAWWQSIQSAKMAVSAKVRNNFKSFVGLDALVDFDWQLAINNQMISRDEFNQLVTEKRRLIFIGGKWIRLDDQFMDRIQRIMREAEEKGLTMYDLLHQQLPTADGESSNADNEYIQIQFEVNNELKRFMNHLNHFSEIPVSAVAQSFQGELRPYQIQGMSWLLFLRKYGLGCCLADDMGLGKTIQIISYLLSVKESEERQAPSLIVCPTSVLGNWQKELEKFAPSLNVALHYGPQRKHEAQFHEAIAKADVVLTSYGLLPQDEVDFLDVKWDAIVLDEAQNIKNDFTKQSKVARKLKGRHTIAVTGTPIENRLSELWTIFDFAIKGYLGSANKFNQNFASPIEREGDKKKTVQLQKLIQPFLLRRSKKDKEIALNLPDKLEQKEFVSLTSEQAALYQSIVEDTLVKVDQTEGFERKGLILQMLSKLKQICNHAALFLKEENPQDILKRSEKTEKLVELLETILAKQESTLVFTQFLDMGHMIQTLLKSQFGLQVPFLKGSVPKKQRDEMIERFQNGEFPILLLSLKAGGTGLNLTAANHVVHYDRWWNPAVENQATDRVHRIGQTKFVHVHKLIVSGTLEEKIDIMLEKKMHLNEEIIQSDNWVTELSTEELKDLLVLSE